MPWVVEGGTHQEQVPNRCPPTIRPPFHNPWLIGPWVAEGCLYVYIYPVILQPLTGPGLLHSNPPLVAVQTPCANCLLDLLTCKTFFHAISPMFFCSAFWSFLLGSPLSYYFHSLATLFHIAPTISSIATYKTRRWSCLVTRRIDYDKHALATWLIYDRHRHLSIAMGFLSKQL